MRLKRAHVLAGLACFCIYSGTNSTVRSDDLHGQFRGTEIRPNVVVFLADDAGYADFGFQGATKLQTPNLDRIALRGVRFSNAYVSSAVCSASRAGILTGRYQNRFGIEFNLPGMPDETVLGACRCQS